MSMLTACCAAPMFAKNQLLQVWVGYRDSFQTLHLISNVLLVTTYNKRVLCTFLLYHCEWPMHGYNCRFTPLASGAFKKKINKSHFFPPLFFSSSSISNFQSIAMGKTANTKGDMAKYLYVCWKPFYNMYP